MGTVPIVACEWRLGAPALDELRIVERAQMDGGVRYAVLRAGWVANLHREWEYEPIPSSRDDAFMARTRLGEWGDAAALALHMANAPSAWDHRRL